MSKPEEAQWPIGYGIGLRIKRSSVRIQPWPLRWVLGQGSLLPLSQGEAFTLASISYLAILVKYILAKKKKKKTVITKQEKINIEKTIIGIGNCRKILCAGERVGRRGGRDREREGGGGGEGGGTYNVEFCPSSRWKNHKWLLESVQNKKTKISKKESGKASINGMKIFARKYRNIKDNGHTNEKGPHTHTHTHTHTHSR